MCGWLPPGCVGQLLMVGPPAPVFAPHARSYASPGLRFGSIDVVLWPNVAEAMGVRSQVRKDPLAGGQVGGVKWREWRVVSEEGGGLACNLPPVIDTTYTGRHL